MWPLLGCSIVAVAIALERSLVFLWRGGFYAGFVNQLKARLDEGDSRAMEWLARRSTPLANVALKYLHTEEQSPAGRQEAVAQEASYQLTLLESRLHWLSMIGGLAPMLGLMGTVMGLVEAFQQIETMGGQVQPGDLAAGIWKALLTTVFGLAVALPALAVYHFLEHRVGAMQIQMQWLTVQLNQWRGHEPVPEIHEPEPATPPVEEDAPVVSGE